MAEILKNFFANIVDVSYIIQVLAYSMATVALLGTDGKGKIHVFRFIAETICLAAVFLLFNLIFTVIFEYTGVVFDSSFQFLAGMVLYMLVRSKLGWMHRISLLFAVFAVTSLTSSIGTVLGNVIETNVAGFDITVTKIASYCVAFLLAFTMYLFPLQRYKTNAFYAMLNVICDILACSLPIIFDYMRRLWAIEISTYFDIAPYIACVDIFLLIIVMTAYFSSFFLSKEHSELMEHQYMEKEMQAQQEQLELSEQKMTQLRELRHDLKNQYAYIQLLLHNRQYEALEKFCSDMTGTFARPLIASIDSGNPKIDSVLNLEAGKATSKGIKMDVRVSVPPSLPFETNDILSLFSNVIDNAIEACEKNATGDASVEVVLNMRGDYLVFCVTNPTDMDSVPAGEKLATDKEDRESHGYGIKIIKKITKKYNGYYRCYIKDGRFIAEGLIDSAVPKNLSKEGKEE